MTWRRKKATLIQAFMKKPMAPPEKMTPTPPFSSRFQTTLSCCSVAATATIVSPVVCVCSAVEPCKMIGRELAITHDRDDRKVGHRPSHSRFGSPALQDPGSIGLLFLRSSFQIPCPLYKESKGFVPFLLRARRDYTDNATFTSAEVRLHSLLKSPNSCWSRISDILTLLVSNHR